MVIFYKFNDWCHGLTQEFNDEVWNPSPEEVDERLNLAGPLSLSARTILVVQSVEICDQLDGHLIVIIVKLSQFEIIIQIMD